MAALEVIFFHITPNGLTGFPDVIVLGEVSLLVLEGTKPPFNHDIVSPAALAIHALTYVIFPEKRLVFVAGKLASLVRIQNFRPGDPESFSNGLDDHAGIKGVVCLPANNAAAVPVYDGCQIEESMPYGDVCNVDGPRLIGAPDVHVFEHIWEDLGFFLPFGKIHPGINGIDAHFTHKPHGSEAAGLESLHPQLL